MRDSIHSEKEKKSIFHQEKVHLLFLEEETELSCLPL